MTGLPLPPDTVRAFLSDSPPGKLCVIGGISAPPTPCQNGPAACASR